MSTLPVKQYIENLLGFLEPLLSFANCHMVDFFTKSVYSNSIPVKIQTEIAELGTEEVIGLIFDNNFQNTPNLKSFVQNSTNFTLKNSPLCLNIDDFMKKLERWGYNVDKFKLEIFMNAKKSHEVEILSGVVASLAKISKISHIIDLGDGKGYLSSMLALHNQIPVLGVDASNINTCGAFKRANKLAKVWNGIPNAPHKSHPKKTDNTSSTNVNLYKQVTKFVDENFNLERLVIDNFQSNSLPLRLGLVGLHTCGDLSPSSMKIFTKNDTIKLICNVGCCYHLLTEYFENDSECGFPLSQFLRDKKITIGRSARMIANQSVERILQAKELPNITIYYRALLQVILEKYCTELPTKQVGRFKKLPTNFKEYLSIAMKRINLDIDISDEEIDELESNYENRLHELNVFYLLRSKLSPLIESLILVDRLLFLREQGFENSFLVQFFDPIVSPRCYGVVALKEFL